MLKMRFFFGARTEPQRSGAGNESAAQFQLVADELEVFASGGHEGGVGAGFGYAATVQNDNLVGIAHCRQAVCHDHHSAPPVEFGQVLHDKAFISVADAPWLCCLSFVLEFEGFAHVAGLLVAEG